MPEYVNTTQTAALANDDVGVGLTRFSSAVKRLWRVTGTDAQNKDKMGVKLPCLNKNVDDKLVSRTVVTFKS